MRRSLIVIGVVIAGVLAGCDNENATSIRNDREEFNRAMQLVNLVQQEHVISDKGLAEYKPDEIDFDQASIQAAMKSLDLGKFRDALSAQAEERLSKLRDSGTASQRTSAALLLANLKMATAHRLRASSNQARNAHSSENGFIADALNSIERADAVAKRRLSGDVSEIISQLGTDKAGAAARVGTVKAEQSRLSTEIAGLQKRITDLEAQRDAKFDEGRKLRTQGFKAKGQEAFDLYSRAIALEQQGNGLETEAQGLRVDRDLAKAKLVVAESELALAMSWQKAVDNGIGAAELRKQALAKVESDVNAARKSVGDQIVASFKVVSDAYAKDVIAPLDAAVGQLDGAIDALSGAENQNVSAEDKLALKMRRLSAQLEKLQVQDDKLISLGTIGRAAENVYGRAASMLPDSFAAIEEAVTGLRNQQTALVEAAASTVTDLNAVLGDSAISGLQDTNALASARVKLRNAAQAYLATHVTVVEANSFDPIGAPPRPITRTTPRPTPPSNTGGNVDDAAAKAMAGWASSIAGYKPNEIWDTLPASYRGDIESWIHTFGEKMDPELWNAVFGFAKKVVSLLQNKKAFILANEHIAALLADADPEMVAKMEKNWDNSIKLISIIVNSELSDLNKIKTLDVSTFLGGTGSSFMMQADKVIEGMEGAPVLKMTASSVQFTVTDVQGDIATLNMVGGPAPKAIMVQKVEGSWLPKDMVDEWPQMKKETEAGLASLEPAQFQENKAQVMGLLAVVGGMVDNLNNAETQEAFDASVQQLMGIVQGLMGGAGGAPPSN